MISTEGISVMGRGGVMGYHLGVDLGTTFTAAAVTNGGPPTMLGLGNRALQIPSVLYFHPDGTVLVGEAAELRSGSDPARTVREFKRRIGDPVPILVAGRPFSAQALSARLLRWVFDKATEQMGEAPSDVTLTYPANWAHFKIDLLRQVAVLADLDFVRACTEPEAAALQYASRTRVNAGDRIAVYDLGGGTFDVCVLEKTETGFRILGRPEGIEHLGGIDFDEAVFRRVIDQLPPAAFDAGSDDDAAQMAALARLRRDCVEAKEALSTDVDAVIPVALPRSRTSVRLTRGEFEDIIRPALEDTIGATRRALRSAETDPARLSAMVLVGGSSRIPLVAELLGNAFRCPIAVDTHPKNDVAIGAARAATSPDAATSLFVPAERTAPYRGPGPTAGPAPGTGPFPAAGASPAAPTTGAGPIARTAQGGPGSITAATQPGSPGSGPTYWPPPGSRGPAGSALPWAERSREGIENPLRAAGVAAASGSTRHPDQQVAGGTPHPLPPGAPSGPDPVRRRRMLIALIAGAAAVVLAATATVVLLRSGDDPAGSSAGSTGISSAAGSSAGQAATSADSAPSAAPSSTAPSALSTTSPSATVTALGLPSSAPLTGDQLVLPRVVDDNVDLYVADIGSGSVLARLTTDPAQHLSPVVSPDRSTIVYLEQTDTTRVLRVMAANGGGDRALFASPPAGCVRANRAAWNPVEPSRIAVICLDAAGKYSLQIVDVDGQAVRVLETGVPRVDDVSFSSDGTAVAFWGSDPSSFDGGSIYVMPADGSAPPAQLTDEKVGTDADPVFSPDGTQIAFRRRMPNGTGQGNFDIFVMARDGQGVRQLTTHAANDQNPSWSPDGTRIAFTSERVGADGVGDNHLWIMSSDGANQRQPLPDDGGVEDSAPAWDRR